MQRQNPIIHFPHHIVERMLLLPNSLIALEKKNTAGSSDYQSIVLIDIDTSKEIAKLLSFPHYQIFEFALFSKKYLAILYDPDNDLSNMLGIWDIDKILNGKLEPDRTIPVNHYHQLIQLPNRELACEDAMNQKFDFYNVEGDKTGSMPITYFSCSSGVILQKSLIHLRQSFIHKKLSVDIIDFEKREKKSSFDCDIGNCHVSVKGMAALSDINCIAIAYEYPRSDYKLIHYFNGLTEIAIWDLSSQKCIKQFRPNGEIVSITALPDGDLVSITKKGAVQFWDVRAGVQKAHIQIEDMTNAGSVLQVLDNHGLLVLYYKELSYVSFPDYHLEKNKKILNVIDDVIAPKSSIPEVRQIIGDYLAFFPPRNWLAKRLIKSEESAKAESPFLRV